MADNKEEKKKKKMKATLVASLDAIAPEIEDGTVLRLDIEMDNGAGGTREYTYAALYVAGAWYVTGVDRLLSTRYDTTIEFFTALAKWKAKNVEVAIGFEPVR